MQCGVRISVLSVTLTNAIYGGAHRNATTVARVSDHELDAERKGEIMTVEWRTIRFREHQQREAD